MTERKNKVPSLRFPEFEGEWEEKKLGDIVNYKSQKYDSTLNFTSYKCIELEHLESRTGQLLGFTDSLLSKSIKNIFSLGDILFGKLRPYLRKYYHAKFDGVCSSEIWVLKGINIQMISYLD